MNVKSLTCLFLLLGSTFSFAEEGPDFEMRVSWVKTLKELMLDIEKREPIELTQSERRFLSLIPEAWADSRYNCFYAGWPSVKKGKYCQNPSRTNSSYERSACQENELQCQPLLFGKGLCVSAATQKDRNSSFAKCEEKFQKDHKGQYDFLKSPTRKESEDLQEFSRVAFDVCKDSKSSICRKVQKKAQDGLKAIQQGFERAPASERRLRNAPQKSATVPAPTGDDVPCEDPTHEHEKLAQDIANVATKSGDDLYSKMKEEFLSSPFCDPMKVVNDPADRPSGFLVKAFMSELKSVEYAPIPKDNQLKRLAEKYKISSDVQTKVLGIMNQKPSNDNERRLFMAKGKGLLLQDFITNYRPSEEFTDIVKDQLVENNIFTEDEDGNQVCPFVSKDAFDKAMKGREEVLKKYGSSLKNKNLITIVDYTRPSNERRMFVIDVSTGKVLHNTWVAHGGGSGTEGKGKDGLGSDPEMSNQPGSNMSSDGFILAGQASNGKLFGNNVLLRGIDENNSNLAGRGVVLHGWGSPMYQYTTGYEEYNIDTEKYDPPYDVIKKVKDFDFSNASMREAEKAFYGLSSSLSVSPYMNPTEGCLGVPMTPVQQLDRKGRTKNQLELLREDLPGSIIFNYSGPDMKSKYF